MPLVITEQDFIIRAGSQVQSRRWAGNVQWLWSTLDWTSMHLLLKTAWLLNHSAKLLNTIFSSRNWNVLTFLFLCQEHSHHCWLTIWLWQSWLRRQGVHRISERLFSSHNQNCSLGSPNCTRVQCTLLNAFLFDLGNYCLPLHFTFPKCSFKSIGN